MFGFFGDKYAGVNLPPGGGDSGLPFVGHALEVSIQVASFVVFVSMSVYIQRANISKFKAFQVKGDFLTANIISAGRICILPRGAFWRKTLVFSVRYETDRATNTFDS